MLRADFTQPDAIRILAGALRNYAVGGILFTPWRECSLIVLNGQLMSTDGHLPSHKRHYRPLGAIDEVLAMEDEEMFMLVTGERIEPNGRLRS